MFVNRFISIAVFLASAVTFATFCVSAGAKETPDEIYFDAGDDVEPGAAEASAASEAEPVKAAAPVAKPKAVVKTAPPVPPVKGAHVAPPKTPARKTASAGIFRTTKATCGMYATPDSEGALVLTVKTARKIWVEDVDSSWVRAFDRKGQPGYIGRDCFE